MKRKIWIHISDSFEDAEQFDKNYYFKMSEEERLETVQILREVLPYPSKKGANHEGRKRFRRAIQVIQQT